MPLHGGEAAYYEHHNSPVRSKKRKRAAQEEKAALKLGVRKDRPPGHRGPDAKRAKPPFCSKKGGLPKGTEAAHQHTQTEQPLRGWAEAAKSETRKPPVCSKKERRATLREQPSGFSE